MKIARRFANPEITTGSMADVTFLLLIFFILTMAFSVAKGLDFALPPETPETPEIDPDLGILICIYPDSAITVDGAPAESRRLAAALARKLDPDAATPRISRPVIVLPAGEAPYGAAVDVLDELRLSEGILGLAHPLNVSLPSRRDVDLWWAAFKAPAC